jgi:hypothetical protein
MDYVDRGHVVSLPDAVAGLDQASTDGDLTRDWVGQARHRLRATHADIDEPSVVLDIEAEETRVMVIHAGEDVPQRLFEQRLEARPRGLAKTRSLPVFCVLGREPQEADPVPRAPVPISRCVPAPALVDIHREARCTCA